MQLGLDCQACDEVLKKERGCTIDGIVPFLIDGYRYTRCPIKLITRSTWEYIEAYSFYKMGFLPNGKAWRNESQKFLDAIIIIENELIKQEKYIIEKQAKMRPR